MRIEKSGDLFVAVIKFEERGIFKRSGWVWNVTLKKWVTPSIQKASEFKEFATGPARDEISAFLRGEGAVVALSMAGDDDIIVPSPEGFDYLPFQRAGIAYALSNKRPTNDVLIADPPGLGKEQPLTAGLLTPTGWATIGDAYVGMPIIGQDGKTHKVTGVYPQGIKPVYRVAFRDGTYTECGADHLWAVTDGNERTREKPWKARPLKELIERGLRIGTANKWLTPLISPVDYPPRDLKIDPYVLGCLLGDGALGGSSIAIVKGGVDSEIFDRVSSRIPGVIKPSYRNYQGDTWRMNLVVPNGGPGDNPLLNALDHYKLRVRGDFKFIPDDYLLASIPQRLDLLRGLMDTDGSSIKNRITFHTCNENLGDDVCDLVRSLGGVAIKRHYVRSDGKSDEWQINVKLDWTCPFYLKRKADQWHPAIKGNGPTKYIESIDLVGEAEQQCISTDACDQLYITDDFIVTHNTVQAVGLSNMLQSDKTLVICPASLKRNWKREFERWDTDGRSVGIVKTITKFHDIIGPDGQPQRGPRPDGRTDLLGPKLKRTETVDVFPETDVVIINKELFERHNERLKAIVWDFMIIDEAHGFSNPKAKTSMHIWGGGRGKARIAALMAKRRCFLTGTPITTSPIKLWPFVKAMDPKGLGRDWHKFVERYCGGYETDFGIDTSGASNLSELNIALRNTFMVRRNKTEVLKELPSKRREIVLIDDEGITKQVRDELSQARKMLAEYEGMLGIDNPEDIVDALNRLLPEDTEGMSYDEVASRLKEGLQVGFEEFSAYRKALAIAKAPFVVEHVKRLIETGEKVILFCYHKDVAAHFRKMFNNAAFVTGDTPTDKRQDEVDRFQNDPNCMVFIGNLNAAGTGFTLTSSSIVVFAELSWVPSDLEQAEDRAWRIGQDNAVLIQYLIVDGSLDARMIEILIQRINEISQALDSQHARR